MNDDLRVLFEDNHILALVKAPGLLVQGDSSGDPTLLELAKQYLKEKYNKPGAVFLGLVHRLDRPTGGVVVFARTSKAASRLSEQFRERSVRKTYLAVCVGKLRESEGNLIHHLTFDEKARKTTAHLKCVSGSKEAELDYKLLAYDSKSQASLLEVKPKSGRKHQIRVQLAKLGHPLVGDLKYSHLKSDGKYVSSFGLWAYQISLTHPVQRHTLTLSSLPDWTHYREWSQFEQVLTRL